MPLTEEQQKMFKNLEGWKAERDMKMAEKMAETQAEVEKMKRAYTKFERWALIGFLTIQQELEDEPSSNVVTLCDAILYDFEVIFKGI